MGYTLEHNCLLVLPDSQLDVMKLEENASFQVTKEGERLYPLNIPFEFCDKDYRYIGKVIVRKISIEKGRTDLDGKIVKIFSEHEAKVFSDNFISPEDL